MSKRMGPGDVPNSGSVISPMPVPDDVTPEDWKEVMGSGRIMAIPDDSQLTADITEGLKKLREPFPDELVEHLPKQKWKGSWKDQTYESCEECGGYHPLGHRTIHLDYIGHAGVTKRLLEVDPFWNWQPLSWTEAGLPRFDQFGGLWIKLTVFGMTRMGYGDAAGKDPGTTAVKEIIGDAIRNAAMRFGVALDLWSKVDRHEGKNPGATDESARRQTQVDNRTSTGRGSKAGAEGAGDDRGANPPRALNQDALDELLGVCNTHGLDTRWVESRYNRDFGPPELVKASPDDIRDYAAILISESTHEPEGVDPSGPGSDEGPAEPGAEEPVHRGADATAAPGPGLQPDVRPEGGPTGGDEAVLAEQVDGSDEAQSDLF